MTLREAKSTLAARWPRSPDDARWATEVDATRLEQLWLTCTSGSLMLLALLRLSANRRTCARATAACLRELRPLLSEELAQGPLASIERLAAGCEEGSDAYERARHACEGQRRLPPGPEALAALALTASTRLLDPSDAAPVTGSEIDCMAEALLAADLVASLDDGRARLAAAIRSDIPDLAEFTELDLSVGDVPEVTPDEIPF